MDREEFDAWWQAFLAAMPSVSCGVLSSIDDDDWKEKPTTACDVLAFTASAMADAALTVWWEKRKELQVPENGGKG